MKTKYRIDEDCRLLREMTNMSREDLASELGVGIATINRWENLQTEPSEDNLENFYSYAYKNGIRINGIKEQLYKEEHDEDEILLFHGSKNGIDGKVKLDASKINNDFGKGFYLGESFRQAALFISPFERSCVYDLSFRNKGLKKETYSVDTEWMLTIACYRGKLNGIISNKKKEKLCKKAEDADYIIAPIADNRMYQIIDSFIDGEITDEQCKHALAATELGMQYVIKTAKALNHLKILERCYLCKPEKMAYTQTRNDEVKTSESKVKAARIKYRGKGKYIDELL